MTWAPKKREGDFTPAEDDRLRRMALGGTSVPSAARRMGRTATEVRKRLNQIGLAAYDRKGAGHAHHEHTVPGGIRLDGIDERLFGRAAQLAETLEGGDVGWHALRCTAAYVRELIALCPDWFSSDGYGPRLTEEGRERLLLKG